MVFVSCACEILIVLINQNQDLSFDFIPGKLRFQKTSGSRMLRIEVLAVSAVTVISWS